MTELSKTSPYALVALTFAQALVDRQFDNAFDMLAKFNPRIDSKQALIDQYTGMFSYSSSEAEACEVMIVDDDWPSKRDGDLAWVYVAIWGSGFSEAVVAIVVDEGSRTAVRVDDWGRP